ncbi:hypothetical protein RvVAR0630_04450 [Agrobacterium vitis]|nr:hypothetical protein RvVAR0630_04450 [Agrobacterium vitis]
MIRGMERAVQSNVSKDMTLSADLHAALGQNRKKRRTGGPKISPFKALTAASSVALLGLSVYTTLTPLPLRNPLPLTTTPPVAAAVPAEEPAAKAPGPSRSMEARAPTSGATVERSTLPDGSVVTKYSPASRDGSGPALVATPHVGQDARVATMPNPDLLEDSPEGKIPVTGRDGLRPVEQYARPWSGAHGTRVAIVVSGLGLSQTGTQRAIKHLPEQVTLAFAASGNSLSRWMQEARRGGHEILLQVPLEPVGYPANDPGRGTLQVGRAASDNLRDLHKAMASMTNYTGLMNYMGGRFLSDSGAMDPVMRDIAARGLLFLDDGSSARSLTATFAKAMNMPFSVADLQLDDQIQEQAILKRLDELERIARRNGSAIGVASAFDESVNAIAKWAEGAKARGIEIVGVSALAMEAQQ